MLLASWLWVEKYKVNAATITIICQIDGALKKGWTGYEITLERRLHFLLLQRCKAAYVTKDPASHSAWLISTV